MPSLAPIPIPVLPKSQPIHAPYNPNRKMLMRRVGIDDESTIVWVGNVSRVIENDALKRLLECCGPLQEWKRPENKGVYATFGFATYASAEGALRAVRLMDGIRLGKEELKVKGDDEVTEYLNEFEQKVKEWKVTRKKVIFTNNFDNQINFEFAVIY
jgi:RNA recognition motif-containing protein